MSNELYERLLRLHNRNARKADYYEHKYKGKEDVHTFHGGWNLGYWEGRVSALEDALDLIEELGLYERFDVCKECKDSYVCDCEKNFGKDCKHPEKYRDGGCK